MVRIYYKGTCSYRWDINFGIIRWPFGTIIITDKEMFLSSYWNNIKIPFLEILSKLKVHIIDL
jgi:hypothetical protein